MEITKLVTQGRDNAKLYGDYASYRSHLSNRIHNLRKKLGIATKPRAKYSSKYTVSAEDISRSHEFVNLILLTSERAWAHAMSMREVHSADKKGITGSSRSHIISRLSKALGYSKHLFTLLAEEGTTNASTNDVLEARAYAASLSGAMQFEKQSWEACVRSYSEARIIYSALAASTKSDMFKDLLSDPVDPSIRYGAYQMNKTSRTVAIPNIARQFFSKDDSKLISQIETLDPDVLNDQPAKAKSEAAEGGTVPKTITWRSRTVDLEDAAIATALASVNVAEKKLADTLAAVTATQAKDRASAYDDILIASQDAVDATKHAIDELAGEGIGQSDRRMQNLQITRTAVSYDMVSWRIGRNRVLVGTSDGASSDSREVPQRKKKNSKSTKEEGTGRKLAHLREKAVLYDAILQSLDSIKELPGVAADSTFLEELDAKYSYFSALKCLTIARSHALLSNPKNALALLARASQKADVAYSALSSAIDDSNSSPPNIVISASQASYLKSLLDGEVQRYRALVELSNLSSTSSSLNSGTKTAPLIEKLSEYPSKEVDLTNLVTYPPRLEPVPVKPLFFDVAWNYIEYPGREISEKVAEVTPNPAPSANGTAAEQAEKKKTGWFGFGR